MAGRFSRHCHDTQGDGDTGPEPVSSGPGHRRRWRAPVVRRSGPTSRIAGPAQANVHVCVPRKRSPHRALSPASVLEPMPAKAALGSRRAARRALRDVTDPVVRVPDKHRNRHGRSLLTLVRDRLVSADRIVAALTARTRRGTELLELLAICAGSQSEAEIAMLNVIRASRLTEPTRQYTVTAGGHNYRLDLAYPTALLAIEVDGKAWHFNAEHRTSDIRRDAVLALRPAGSPCASPPSGDHRGRTWNARLVASRTR